MKAMMKPRMRRTKDTQKMLDIEIKNPVINTNTLSQKKEGGGTVGYSRE